MAFQSFPKPLDPTSAMFGFMTSCLIRAKGPGPINPQSPKGPKQATYTQQNSASTSQGSLVGREELGYLVVPCCPFWCVGLLIKNQTVGQRVPLFLKGYWKTYLGSWVVISGL